MRLRSGKLITSRLDTTMSLSGDEDRSRSGDTGVERGGVNIGSVPARAASTHFTISLDAWIDDLFEARDKKMKNFVTKIRRRK